MSSARKGFLLTDALVAVFIVFLLSGIISAVMSTHLSAKERIIQAAEQLEEEAHGAFMKGEQSCRVCTAGMEEDTGVQAEEEMDSSSYGP